MINIKEYYILFPVVIGIVLLTGCIDEEQGLGASIHSKDTDRDGLSNEEELKLGTSANNPDTDGDTVPDGKDEHPIGGDRLITKNFKWTYQGNNWDWSFGVPSDVFDYYNNMERKENPSIEYVTYNDPTIKSLAKGLEQRAEEKRYGKAEFATAFVQSLPYLKDAYTRYDDYPKYPIQTLVDGSGDCEDSSYLAAALIAAMNIDVILIHPEGHVGIGIWCDGCSGTYWELKGRKYYYLETTAPNWKIGQYPSKYSSAKLYHVFNRT